MSTPRTYHKSAYIPSDWTTTCEAKCRKNGKRCPHRSRFQISNTIAAHCVLDGNQFSIQGRPVYLCWTHHRSFSLRAKRLLSLPLVEGGHLSPYNKHGYGSVVIAQGRVDFAAGERAIIPKAWGVVTCDGYVPDELLARLPKLSSFATK